MNQIIYTRTTEISRAIQDKYKLDGWRWNGLFTAFIDTSRAYLILRDDGRKRFSWGTPGDFSRLETFGEARAKIVEAAADWCYPYDPYELLDGEELLFSEHELPEDI